jgi:hypothetical protein
VYCTCMCPVNKCCTQMCAGEHCFSRGL